MYIIFVTELPHPYNKIGDGPEGPEVAKVADLLKTELEGKILTSIIISEKAKHDGLDKISFPKTIVKVESYGKKILIYLQDDNIIANELRMSGYWSRTSTKHTKFTFLLNTEEKIYFISVRGLGKTVVLTNNVQKGLYFSKLGPDILKETISKEDWANRFRSKTKKRKSSRPFLICDALIEQSIFCGLGNYLRADIMYMAEIKPDKPAQELTDDEYERLRVASHHLIRKSYQSNGFTIQHYQNVDGSKGLYFTLVYGKKVCPKGNPIVKSRFRGKWPKRTVHWVPAIQK